MVRMFSLSLICLVYAVSAAADPILKRFYGKYSGSGYTADQRYISTLRDMSLEISSAPPDGFRVTWTTLKRKGADPNRLRDESSTHTATFRTTDKPRVYRAVNYADPPQEGLAIWARTDTNLLVVYRLAISRSGVPELHIYRRRLTAKGLELLFLASRDGKEIRTVRGRYTRWK